MDLRHIRRFVFQRLPESAPWRERVIVARAVSKVIPGAIIALRNDGDRRRTHEIKRSRATARNQATERLCRSAEEFMNAARDLDALPRCRDGFSRLLAEKAKHYGLSVAHDDTQAMSDFVMPLSIMRAISDTVAALREPIPVEPPIAQQVPHARTDFYRLISSLIEPLIPDRKPRAKLISELCKELGLEGATATRVEERLRN